MSSGSATVPEHLNVQNQFSTAVVQCGGLNLYLLYPEIFVFTLCIAVGIRTAVFCSIDSDV